MAKKVIKSVREQRQEPVRFDMWVEDQEIFALTHNRFKLQQLLAVVHRQGDLTRVKLGDIFMVSSVVTKKGPRDLRFPVVTLTQAKPAKGSR